MKCIYLLFYIFLANDVNGKNILIIDDLPSPSHQIWHDALGEALVLEGYNVTVMRSFTLPVKQRDNLHIIPVEVRYEDTSTYNLSDVNVIRSMGPNDVMKLFFDNNDQSCDSILRTNAVQTLIEYPEDFVFDAIVMEMTTAPCLFPLIQILHYPPVIGTTPFLLPPFLSELFGNEVQPSYLPFFSVDFSDDMSFLERLQNHFWTRYHNLIFSTASMRKLERVTRKKFGKDMRPLKELQQHISLLLCNHIPGLHYPQPLTPNIIPVGGLHIKPAKALPEDLRKIMDNAKNGVILFSLGSYARSDLMGTHIRNSILKAFSQLKETVLWKFESELNDLPNNVIIRKWLPQMDILGHPNLKLFISHGGGLSIMEAAYFGVPVLGMPFIVDQHTNVESLVSRGLGLKVNYFTLTANNFLNIINELLLNNKYSNNMKKVSEIIRDQPQTPLERAIFWIKYSMRHNGTHFLQPRSREMFLMVSSSTDIFWFLLLAVGTVLYLFCKIIHSRNC